MKKELCFEEASAALRYDPETGLLWWKERARRRNLDKPAGTQVKSGYLFIRIKGKLYYAHRIAYLLYHGDCPADAQVDHINHVRTDNRKDNLRIVSASGNMCNASMRIDNSTGVTGVSYIKRDKKYRAQIQIYGKPKYLGMFNTVEEAAAAREKANKEYGFHRNHGK